jgi:predicted DNA binding CopG/RHH family protein
MKALQKFSKAYLEECKKFSPEEIVEFLENFRKLHGPKDLVSTKEKSKLISLKVAEDLLAAFKAKSKLENIPYQTQIKRLMKEWLK